MSKPAAWKADPSDPVYQEMRSKVLASASELIRETGVSGLRLDTVARHAGVARSSLYRYFDSKEQVVYELLVYEFNKLSAKMTQATNGIEDPVERILEIVYLSTKAYRTDPGLAKLIGPANEKSISLVSFALEKIPALMEPYLGDFNFFAGDSDKVREEKNEYLARWILNIVFSLGVFGNGGLSVRQEKAMLRNMLVPVLEN